MYKSILEKYDNNAKRLMDILTDIQLAYGYISEEAYTQVSQGLNISKVDIQQTVSFYHFFETRPTGKYTVYLNDSAVANMKGNEEIAKAFEKETGG